MVYILRDHSKYLILCILILSSCGQGKIKDTSSISTTQESQLNQAKMIVQGSIEAHGGMERWKNLREISYKKTIILFDSSGMQESRIVQTHNYSTNPSLTGSIQWTADDELIEIRFSDGQGTRYVNEIAEVDKESKASATGSFLSAFYVLFQPWKLLDTGTELEYLGEDILTDGREVWIVSPTYGERKEGDDRWWYYIDKKTNLVAANMVDHSGRYSLITNVEYDKSTDLIFNYHRKSHFVDSTRNIKYLRAEYFYEDFQLLHED